MTLLDPNRRKCEKCGIRPIPPGPKGSGKRAKICLRCVHDKGRSVEPTLLRIARRDGLAYALEAAAECELEFPDNILRKVADEGVPDRRRKPENESDALQRKRPTALKERLLAAGLGIDSDPRRAAELVGLDPDDSDLEALARGLEEHPLRFADANAVAQIVRQAAAVAALRGLEEAGRGDSSRMARFATGVHKFFAAHETLTGGTRPLPPVINLDFQVSPIED